MAVSYEEKLKEQSKTYLEDGERMLAAFVARPRGATTAQVSGLGPGAIGNRKIAKQKRAAEQAGLKLANPMALALTDTRLLVLAISRPKAMGKGGDVQALVSTAALDDVESVDVRRLLVGKTVTVNVSGVSFKLEVGAGEDPKGFAAEFARSKRLRD